MPIVTLLTDFGTADGYVAEMKGVLLSAAPGVQLVDATHDVPPHDVEYARLTLARYWRRFPVGTVHLAIVDPGVGSARRAIAVRSHDRFLVGPDNGVLSPALLMPGARAVELEVPPGASATFHGRDVFAPAAARLAAGAALDALGPPCDDCLVRRTAEAHRLDDGGVQGEVIAVDRFGNLITNLVTARAGEIEIGGFRLPIRRTYADVAPGALVALPGSSGLLEVAMREGSAADRLGVSRGTAVVFRSRE
jgi:S-adenosylmethionine hydrolase